MTHVEWSDAEPGDCVTLGAHARLESIVSDKDFSVGNETVYCLCIGRVASTTVSGLTVLKVYLLTPVGVGYKRINVGGDRNVDRQRKNILWGT